MQAFLLADYFIFIILYNYIKIRFKLIKLALNLIGIYSHVTHPFAM